MWWWIAYQPCVWLYERWRIYVKLQWRNKKNELETHPTEVYYRAYILTYFAQHCINLESDFVELIKGNLPESIKKVSLKKISFLHIDLNNAHSEI